MNHQETRAGSPFKHGESIRPHHLKDIDELAYLQLFTPITCGELPPGFENPPPPLFLDAGSPEGGFVQAGSIFTVEISLVGEVAALAQRVITALKKVGQDGLGKTSAPAELLSIEPIWPDDSGPTWIATDAEARKPTVHEWPDVVRIVLTSPFREPIREGKSTPDSKIEGEIISKSTFTAKAWIEAIRMRIALLDIAYGDAARMDVGSPVPRIEIDDVQLWDVDQIHYSSTGEGDLDVSGVMGSFRLPVKNSREHWPFIWAGQWYQAGEHPNLGLGAYKVIS